MKINIIIQLFLLSGCLMSCASPKYSTSSSPQPEMTNNEKFPSERIMLYSVDMELIVEVPDSTKKDIENLVKVYNGYVLETSSNRVVLRIESGKFENIIIEISKMGKVQSMEKSGTDVTDDYVDYNIRLENAQKTRSRYLELLGKAQRVDEMLEIERELERVNENIELLKGKINRLDHLKAYATITVEIKEKIKPGLLGYIGLGVYYPIKWLFVRN
ncbi:DUF4349 domain-containing protein [Flexithrix dorotheae]|uniref:DUF4349 domain-containing protein n=1 Tax=Flexithrix dorotheae TaxID=70993 RepID=UPI00037D2EB9|nr:DUF4349 domain-containing protein [Flexithrix dorotheae]